MIRLRMSAKDAHYGGNLVDGRASGTCVVKKEDQRIPESR